MIGNWLLKHRWVNELVKTLAACVFGWFGYALWQAGKLASLEINPADSYKLMVFGVVVGIMGMLSLFIIVDVAYSVIKMKRFCVASSKEERE